jgi:hypothetical protein
VSSGRVASSRKICGKDRPPKVSEKSRPERIGVPADSIRRGAASGRIARWCPDCKNAVAGASMRLYCACPRHQNRNPGSMHVTEVQVGNSSLGGSSGLNRKT